MNKRELRKWLRDHGVEDYFIVVCDKKRHKVIIEAGPQHLQEMLEDALGRFVSYEKKDMGLVEYVG